MKVAIMQPYFFPYISYFQLLGHVDKFVILDDVNFIKKGWIHRNNLKVNNAAWLFTIPLKNASQNRKINEIEVSEWEVWKIKFLKTVEQTYKTAPYFEEVFRLLNQIMEVEPKTISELNFRSLKILRDYLDLKTEIIETSSVFNNQHLKAEERIVDICKQLHTTEYFNPIGGQELYRDEAFRKEGMKLNFIKASPELSKDGYYSLIHTLFMEGKPGVQSKLTAFSFEKPLN